MHFIYKIHSGKTYFLFGVHTLGRVSELWTINCISFIIEAHAGLPTMWRCCSVVGGGVSIWRAPPPHLTEYAQTDCSSKCQRLMLVSWCFVSILMALVLPSAGLWVLCGGTLRSSVSVRDTAWGIFSPSHPLSCPNNHLGHSDVHEFEFSGRDSCQVVAAISLGTLNTFSCISAFSLYVRCAFSKRLRYVL